MITSASCSRRAALALLCAGALALSGCAGSSPLPLGPVASPTAVPTPFVTPTPTPSPTPSVTPSPTPAPTPDPVLKALSAMSTRQKAAQLIIAGFYSDDEALTLVGEDQVGGLIFFGRNMGSVTAVQSLTGKLASAEPVAPLLGTDQEGGSVSRLPQEMGTFESAQKVGERGDPQYALSFGLRTAQALQQLGLNTDFAPVLDINSNPDNPVIGPRAFGTTAAEVARIAPQVAAGLRQGGIIAVGKHFPGHGDTREDSHTTLPRLDISLETLRQRELVPFQAAMGGGIPAIMVAHIVFTALDDQPASLSPVILDSLLREELGFQGVILSDDLCMQAIAKSYTPAQGAVKAILAGCDMVIIGHDPESVVPTIDALIDAVISGQLSPDELDAKVIRILRLKQTYGLLK